MEIKGFTHKTKEGKWFLTDQPVLKSCCHIEPKEDEVIFLEVDEPLYEKRLYKFEGIISHDGTKRIFHGKKEESAFMGSDLLVVFSTFAIFIALLTLKHKIQRRWEN